jgi:hypothetical protein
LLELEVLPAPYWVGDDRRLEPRLRQPHRDRATPLRELGSGLRAWAAVAILEGAAAERASVALDASEIGRLMNAMTRFAEHERDVGVSPGLMVFGERRRLLIVDEPERHLHPRAQKELAPWLSASADDRDTLLATHAVPFLNLPQASVTYALVTRLRNGLTNATDISGETFGALERMSVEAGLSSAAEALQVGRLVLLVEGTHDERVIHHFYGGELARSRVLVVPVRGARNLNAIFDAPWLSRIGLPLVILFDDVDASIATARKKPSGQNVAARSVWEMLRYWDRPEPKPRVASFNLPDIFRALPESCLARAIGARGGKFPGWDTIDKRFQGTSGQGFKPLLIKASRLAGDTDLTELLDATLEVCRKRPDRALENAIAEVIDAAELAATALPPARGPRFPFPSQPTL